MFGLQGGAFLLDEARLGLQALGLPLEHVAGHPQPLGTDVEVGGAAGERVVGCADLVHLALQLDRLA
eukprot:scaffold493194_cov32-Prasinocladus_malaysianus.AAC.1